MQNSGIFREFRDFGSLLFLKTYDYPMKSHKNFKRNSKNKKESAFIMRKQTKLVAVASAAALLAVGASMTSFAATGWVEEDGQWYYYDKDGNRVEDDWKKSGDNWYWLDSEEGGAMATDKLVEDDDDTYYVDSNGVMVRNTWVKVVNEEQDEDEDPAEYNYYYMQSNGKAYKAGDGDTTKFKTIDGKRYAFDSDGKMLYGWVDANGARITDEDGWAENDKTSGQYYLGSWDDGAMKTGWQKIYVHDTEEDEDMEHWFYFKSNGKMEYNNDDTKTVKEKKINSKKYGFDHRGVMVYEWTVATKTNASQASTSSWKYFNSPEDGARVTKGWFKVVAANEDNSFSKTIVDLKKGDGQTFDYSNADDETEKWYYADGDGNIKAGEIAKIKGKYYGFHPDGWMLSGLVFMSVDDDGKIDIPIDDYKSVDSDELDDIIDDKLAGFDKLDASQKGQVGNCSLYYFGSDEDHDGVMKTGNVTVVLDGESYAFQFSKSGGAEGKGKGVMGLDDDKYIYKYGLKIKADTDDKYQVVYVENDGSGNGLDVGSDGVFVTKIDSQDLRAEAANLGQNKDGESVSVVSGGYENSDTGKFTATTWHPGYYLVNTSGAISKKKSAAKDGNDWYFYVNKDKNIAMYTNNKNFKYDAKHSDLNPDNLDGVVLEDWDKWPTGGFDPLYDN